MFAHFRSEDDVAAAMIAKPAPHTVHAVQFVAPDTLENVPEAQGVHEDWPVTLEKKPGVHVVHVEGAVL